MGDAITLRVNGRTVSVAEGTSVAAAIVIVGITTFRRSVTGERRGPLCGMGICVECRATVNGVKHRRTCQMMCSRGMEVETG